MKKWLALLLVLMCAMPSAMAWEIPGNTDAETWARFSDNQRYLYLAAEHFEEDVDGAFEYLGVIGMADGGTQIFDLLFIVAPEAEDGVYVYDIGTGEFYDHINHKKIVENFGTREEGVNTLMNCFLSGGEFLWYDSEILLEMSPEEIGAAMSAARGGNPHPADGRQEQTVQASEREWKFRMLLQNTTSETLVPRKVIIKDNRTGVEGGAACEIAGDELAVLGLDVEFWPGDSLEWNHSAPVNDAFDRREYVFVFDTPSGETVEMAYRFVLGADGSVREETPEGGMAGGGENSPETGNGAGLLKPVVSGSDWRFEIMLENHTDSALTLERVQIIDRMDGVQQGEIWEKSGAQLADLMLADLVLLPGDTFGWGDGHPIVDFFNGRDYIFIFRNEAGEEVEMAFRYDMTESAGSAVAVPEGRWAFEILLVNDEDTELTLERLQIVNYMNGEPQGEIWEKGGAQLADVRLADTVLGSGDMLIWDDGHPVVDFFNGRDYCFIFRSSAGEEVVKTVHFEMNGAQIQAFGNADTLDYAQDEGQDLLTLRHDARFEVEVAPGVYWVPVNSLGDSRYTNAQVHDMLGESPENKQAAVGTLYEALQLYQIGGFYASDDNVRIAENGYHWEHHKPGYHAVRTNTGCCATDSNWLRYILAGDYEEVGYMATSQRDGSGHIFNYILQDGWYYFIDLTHYRTDWIATAVENGDEAGYRRTDFIAGNLHRCRSVQAYVDYVQSVYGDPPGLMFLYTAEDCLAVDSVRNGEWVTIVYEDHPEVTVEVVFDDGTDRLDFSLAPQPVNLPDWSQNPDHPF